MRIGRHADTGPVVPDPVTERARSDETNFPWGRQGAFTHVPRCPFRLIAGSIVHHFGHNAGFLFLAAVAGTALGILYFFMPETRDKEFLTPT